MATADTYIRCARPYAKTPVHAHHNVYLTQWVQTQNEEYVHACGSPPTATHTIQRVQRLKSAQVIYMPTGI